MVCQPKGRCEPSNAPFKGSGARGLGSVAMNIHEYQAKALLHEFGVPISRGVPVLRPQDADAAAKTLPGPIWVVKSQIHAGGRGKGKFKESYVCDQDAERISQY